LFFFDEMFYFSKREEPPDVYLWNRPCKADGTVSSCDAATVLPRSDCSRTWMLPVNTRVQGGQKKRPLWLLKSILYNTTIDLCAIWHTPRTFCSEHVRLCFHKIKCATWQMRTTQTCRRL